MVLDNILEELPSQFNDKPKIIALFQAFAKQMDEINTVFNDIDEKTTLDGAYGVNLDNVGGIVNLSRKQARKYLPANRTDEEISDDRYRQLLQYQILANTGDYTYDTLIDGLKLLWNTESPIYYAEQEPATIHLALPTYSLDETLVNLNQLVLKPSGVGVEVDVTYADSMLLQSKEIYAPCYMYSTHLDEWNLDGTIRLDGNHYLGIFTSVDEFELDDSVLLDGSRSLGINLDDREEL